MFAMAAARFVAAIPPSTTGHETFARVRMQRKRSTIAYQCVPGRPPAGQFVVSILSEKHDRRASFDRVRSWPAGNWDETAVFFLIPGIHAHTLTDSLSAVGRLVWL